jgi:hypothetical protein
MDIESTTSWETLFSELNSTENKLLSSAELLNKAALMSEYLKTDHKADEWRNLHNMISKSGKTVEKQYIGYNFEESSGNDSIVWKRAIFENLIREGFTFNSSSLEGAESHRKAYAQLSEFIEIFDCNADLIFE